MLFTVEVPTCVKKCLSTHTHRLFQCISLLFHLACSCGMTSSLEHSNSFLLQTVTEHYVSGLSGVLFFISHLFLSAVLMSLAAPNLIQWFHFFFSVSCLTLYKVVGLKKKHMDE